MEYTLGGDIYGLLAMILIGIVAPLLVGGYFYSLENVNVVKFFGGILLIIALVV